VHVYSFRLYVVALKISRLSWFYFSFNSFLLFSGNNSARYTAIHTHTHTNTYTWDNALADCFNGSISSSEIVIVAVGRSNTNIAVVEATPRAYCGLCRSSNDVRLAFEPLRSNTDPIFSSRYQNPQPRTSYASAVDATSAIFCIIDAQRNDTIDRRCNANRDNKPMKFLTRHTAKIKDLDHCFFFAIFTRCGVTETVDNDLDDVLWIIYTFQCSKVQLKIINTSNTLFYYYFGLMEIRYTALNKSGVLVDKTFDGVTWILYKYIFKRK
jgi:hypothetical protein